VKVELIYESGCPNVVDTRENLLRAFSEARLTAKWTEWDVASRESPARVYGFGSPTVLVDGSDVAGHAPTGTRCCRFYADSEGRQSGVPPVHAIREALLGAAGSTRAGWRGSVAVLPGLGVALLPKLACPMCWPAYAAILSTLGLSFLISARYLLGITLLFLVVSVGSLAYRARERYGFGPVVIGAMASAVLLLGKFRFESKAAMYGGLALLAAASLWNGWPRRSAAGSPCPQCVPAGGDLTGLDAKEKKP
jgi:mercuric ion transport protein